MLNFYNTLTREIEPFKSSEPKKVKMYTCGPSTYQPAHIGNYRTFLYEDIVQRYLEYLGYTVMRTMTLTDIEDKAIEQAKKENLTVEQLTAKNEAIFFKDFELLRIKRPDCTVRASKATDQAVALINRLVEKGYAYSYRYKGEENVYFDPLSFNGFGKLAHLDMNKWPRKKRRFHKDTYPGTPWNKGDFILWHGCKLEDFCYETSIGTGRPAWNIQDAAIVTKTLGFSIDLGCGGIDNLVRHHDYTLAIAETVSGEQFSRFWLHGGHLFVDGKKMSKSKGNVYYPCDLVEKGFTGAQIRFFLIYGPYREKLNFTFEKMKERTEWLTSLQTMIKQLQDTKPSASASTQDQLIDKLTADFEVNMNNNLNVKKGFEALYEIIKEIYKNRASLSLDDKKNILEKLSQINSVLQCLF